MYPYTVEGLARQTDGQRSPTGDDETPTASSATGAPAPAKSSNADEAELANYKNPCTKYRLKGVVVHQGSATAGHYYTYIRTRRTRETVENGLADRWLKFNDDVVTEEEVNMAGRVVVREEKGDGVVAAMQFLL